MRAIASLALGAVASFVALASCSDYGGLDARADSGSPAIDAGADVGADAPAADVAADASVDANVGCPGCTTVADAQDEPTDLLLVGPQLLWVNSGSNVSVAVTLDLASNVIETDGPYAAGMRDLVFVSGSPWALAGGTVHRIFPASSCADYLSGVVRLSALADSFVYADATSLHRGTCTSTPSTMLLPARPGIHAVAGEATRAWFADASGTIATCQANASDCEATLAVLATGQGDVSLLALSDTRVYWATPAPNATIRTQQKSLAGSDAGSPTTIAADVGDPKAIVARSGDVYWTDAERGTVMWLAAGATAPVVVADGLLRPWGLGVSAAELYVAESGRGRVLRIPKP